MGTHYPIADRPGVGLVSREAAYVQLLVRGDLHYRHLIGMGVLYLGFAAYAVTISIQ